MAPSQKSVLIVGGGIAGLCLGVVAQNRGYAVTIVARDVASVTASGVAAGMIAPAMEALGEADPVAAFQRLKTAQAAWLDMFDLWPNLVQRALADGMSQPALYFWDETSPEATAWPTLVAMGAACQRLDYDALRTKGFDPEGQGAAHIKDDWLVETSIVLATLEQTFEAKGTIGRDAVRTVTATSVTLAGGEKLSADHVVIAAGYGSSLFADTVPSLKTLSPIKGHLLDLPRRGGTGIIRSASGYLASYGATAKFGATMQIGRDDLDIEADIVAVLKSRAANLPLALPLQDVVPRTGIRASSPDGWPMIGRDSSSGVWLSTALRRNGYVFAPFAAGVILDAIEGKSRGDAAVYDPNRFG